MKLLQSSELPIGKSQQTRRRTSKFAPLIALIILLTIPLYYPCIRDSSKKLVETSLDFNSDYPILQPSVHLDPPHNDNTNDGKRSTDMAVVRPHVGPTKKNHRNEKKAKQRRPRKPRADVNKDSRDRRSTGDANDRSLIRFSLIDEEQCDLFTGEWVENLDGPYYTNATCNAIQEHQNCLKFGRPDTGFLKWRWQPDDCDLPIFDPESFLELVRGKSLAFVGDSVARNHMQSLICLLSRVTYPIDLSDWRDQNRRYEYREHDFNISMFWSPYLVKTENSVPNDDKRPFKLFLDEFDQHWTSNIASFDYVIISAGHWFFRPTYFYLHNRLTGCLYCPESNVNHVTSQFSYRRAFRTALRAFNEARDFNGVLFLRSFAPSHFEGERWDKGGDCVRTRPFKRNENDMENYSLEMYLIQMEELRIAQKAKRRNRGKFRLFDATQPMQLRPDGHPSKYGHWQGVNQTFANDCVHWCLPGPIDSWNDFLQELLKREILGDDSKQIIR